MATMTRQVGKIVLLNVFVRLKSDSNQYCHWPVMQDRRDRRDYYIGSFLDRNPSIFTRQTLGNAVAWALANPCIVAVEVRVSEENYVEDVDSDGTLNGCPGDVSARDSF